MGKHQALRLSPASFPKEGAAGPASQDPCPGLAAARIRKGDRKGRPLRPSEDHSSSLNSTVPSTKYSSNRGVPNTVGQLRASRPAQGTALGYRISSSKVAPERQVLLSSHFYPFYQQQPKLRDVKELAQVHTARMEQP